MGNMSYCRFENTARDLQDCLDAVWNKGSRCLSDLASPYEKEGLKELLQLAEQFLDEREIIEEALEAWEAENE